MATFTIEAESFDLLRASQAQAISLPSDSPTDTFTDYEEESRLVQLNPVTLVRMPADPESAPGDKARITTVFDRGSGIYTVKVNYVDERNGLATGELIIGDNTPLTWTFDGNQGPVPGTPYVIARSVSSSNLSILDGDRIILTAQRQANEAARIDSFEFTEVVTGELEFSATAINSGEGDGTVEIKVTRSNASVGDARATVLIGGTADETSDYTLDTGVFLITSEVFFAQGDVEETITISLVDDFDIEGEETLTLTLEAIAGESVIGAQDTFTLTIEDNDEPPTPPTPTPTPDVTGGDNAPTPSPTPTPDVTGGDNTPTPSPTPTPDVTGGDNTPTPSPTPTPDVTGGDNTPTPSPTPTPDVTGGDNTPTPSPTPTPDVTGGDNTPTPSPTPTPDVTGGDNTPTPSPTPTPDVTGGDNTPTPSPTPTPDVTGGDNTPTPSPTPTPDVTGGDNTPTPSPTPTPDVTGGDNAPTPSPTPTPDVPDDTPDTIVAGEEIEGTGRDGAKGATRWADILNGSDAADVVDALRGDDFVWTGMGDDIVFGRRGRDVVNVGSGNDWVRGGRHRDVLKAGSGDDFINGCRGGDSIDGAAGNDTLIGHRGQDIIAGGAGDDILRGGRARDQLDGGAGNDSLAGGPGSDTLTGGAGNDIFVLSLKIGSDTITDFEVKGDRLQLPNTLTFDDLDIQSVEGGTIISTVAGKALATLEDVDAALVVDSVFV